MATRVPTAPVNQLEEQRPTAPVSCSECQRRKQKCDKQWPCNHCQDRRVPHLCTFKKRRLGSFASPNDGQYNTRFIELNPIPALPSKRKISYVDEPDDEAIAYASRHYHLEKNLENLGMTNHGRNSMLREILAEAFTFTSRASTGVDDVANQQSDAFPPKPYTDVLIHNFLDNINFLYCICHPESLLQEYESWWQKRRTCPDIELEGLLFRLMAISAQFLPVQICERLESTMGEDIVTLKYRWHRSAEARHGEIRPGKGGLKHVQQLFLCSSFYKAEAMFVDSWHALSGAIRVAQELNMHRDSVNCNISKFERELRRQVWCSLYTWDRLTAFLFDRPPIIYRGRMVLIEPTPDLHQDPKYPNSPSPILGRVYEFRLAKALDQYLDEDPQHADYKHVTLAIKDIKDWLKSLPSVLSIHNADTTWDSQHPRIKHSRLTLHITAYSCLFCILKPCLNDNRFPNGSNSTERACLRSACIEYCIRMTDVIDRLTRTDTHSRFLMSFCLFETSATVCTAMIKDKSHALPKRAGVSRALGRSKTILNRLRSNTMVANSSAKILNQLLDCLKSDQPETSNFILEGETLELDMDYAAPVEGVERHVSSNFFSASEHNNNSDDTHQALSTIESEEHLSWAEWPGADDFETTNFLRCSDGLDTSVDFSLVDQVWDWQSLGLDLTKIDTAELTTVTSTDTIRNEGRDPQD